MTHRSRMASTDDSSDTTDEDYLQEYGARRGMRTLDERSNPFHQGEPLTAQVSRSTALHLIGEVLYAVRMPDGLIKIGHTTDLRLRLRHATLRGCTLLAIKPGTYADEQALHDALAAHSHHGREWYWPARPVLDVVDGWRRDAGMTPSDRAQFDAHPDAEPSTYGRGAQGRFERWPDSTVR